MDYPFAKNFEYATENIGFDSGYSTEVAESFYPSDYQEILSKYHNFLPSSSAASSPGSANTIGHLTSIEGITGATQLPTSFSSSHHPTTNISQSAGEGQDKPRRKGGRKPRNNPLPPHLEERRRLRRIRNKDAAQKIRERQTEYTGELSTQIQSLETQLGATEQLIHDLTRYKQQCEEALSSHSPRCRIAGTSISPSHQQHAENPRVGLRRDGYYNNSENSPSYLNL